MEPEPPPIPEPSAVATEEVPQRKKLSCLTVFLGVILIVVVSAVGAYFWINRPIKPVELSEKEVRVVEEKVEILEAEPSYQAGSKEIVLTERELNGLINANTTLGDKLKLNLVTGEIHARVESDIAQDVPVIGGKKLKARARFLVGTVEGKTSFVLDDFTLWGVSLPNEWLGGIKGIDLVEAIFGDGPGLSGIEEFRIERGRLVIRLAE